MMSFIRIRLVRILALTVFLGGLPLLNAQESTSTESKKSSETAAPSSKTAAKTEKPATENTDATPASKGDVPELVVTANRSETPIDKTTASVTVVTRKEIEQNQYHSIDQALAHVPGLNLVPTGTPGQTEGVFIRGTKTESTSILINGRHIPYNLAGSYGLESLTTDNVERIEVVRGPLSSTQGGPAIGGVINIITQDGRGVKPMGEASFEYGSFQSFRETVASRGAVGPFDWAVGASRLDTDYQRDNNQYRLSNINSKFGVQISKSLYADLAVIYNNADAGSPSDIFNPHPSANLLRETLYISPGLAWDTTENWKQSLYYTHSQYRQVAQDFPPLANFFPPPAFLDFGQDNRVQVNTDQVDYQSEVKVFDAWKLTPGFMFSDTGYYRIINVPNELNFPTTPAGTKDINNNVTDTAAFIQSQLDITRDWAFNSSMRLDHYSDFGNPVTWRVGSSYRTPSTRTLIHASYGTGFAPPTPQDLAPVFGGTPNLNPETSKGYEVGVEQPFWSDRIKASFTWFHNDITNIIVYPAPFFTAANGGDAMTEGVEVGLLVKPIPQVDIDLNYTYLTADNESTGLRLVRRPRHSVKGMIGWTPIECLRFGMEANYIADWEDSNPATFAQQEGDDYFVMRMTAAWQINSHVQVFGRIENITNAQYEQTIGFPALDEALYAGMKVGF